MRTRTTLSKRMEQQDGRTLGPRSCCHQALSHPTETISLTEPPSSGAPSAQQRDWKPTDTGEIPVSHPRVHGVWEKQCWGRGAEGTRWTSGEA